MKFTRSPKKLIQLRLDPRDVRIIDRESKRSGIDRAQLVRSWVKEKISHIHNDERLWGLSDQANYYNKKHFSTTSSTLNFRKPHSSCDMKDGVLFSGNFDQNRIMKKEIEKNGFSPNKHTHRPEKRKGRQAGLWQLCSPSQYLLLKRIKDMIVITSS